MIVISNEPFDRIKIHSEQSYNEECCGALFGNSKNDDIVINDLLEFENEKEDSRQSRFLISPAQYNFAEKLAKEKNLELLGFYHSHPDHPAIPSQFDIDNALPWFLYIIVSVNKAKAENVNAWILKEDRSGFERQGIKVRASVGSNSNV
jgi:proteasome lid subunit RPN8/RPN11